MNKRFTEINEFMESVRALTDKASALSVTNDTIAHICAIDPEFTQDVERLISLFTSSSTITTTTDNTNTTYDTCVTDIVTINEPESDIIETTTATDTTNDIDVKNEETEMLNTNEPEDSVNDNWKVHPTMKDYRLSPDGRVQHLSPTGWNDIKINKRYGYLSFGRHQLAREMLNTFSHLGDRSLTPFYRDGNKYNCNINNLEWTTSRKTSKDPSEIERACKIIAENPNMKKAHLLNKILEEAHVGRTCYESIMRGGYLEISEKYFHICLGKVYPIDPKEIQESKVNNESVTEAEDIKLIDLISFTKNPGLIRSRFPEKPTTDDRYALILSYVADGKRTAADIQMSVHRDFGKRLYIANQEIEKILTKSVHKDICDKIF